VGEHRRWLKATAAFAGNGGICQLKATGCRDLLYSEWRACATIDNSIPISVDARRQRNVLSFEDQMQWNRPRAPRPNGPSPVAKRTSELANRNEGPELRECLLLIRADHFVRYPLEKFRYARPRSEPSSNPTDSAGFRCSDDFAATEALSTNAQVTSDTKPGSMVSPP